MNEYLYKRTYIYIYIYIVYVRRRKRRRLRPARLRKRLRLMHKLPPRPAAKSPPRRRRPARSYLCSAACRKHGDSKLTRSDVSASSRRPLTSYI